MTITSTASCTYTSLSWAAHCSNENCTKKCCLFCIDLFCGIECAIDKFMDGKLAIIKAFYIIVGENGAYPPTKRGSIHPLLS